jgi:hypothetical protein
MFNYIEWQTANNNEMKNLIFKILKNINLN